MRKKPLVSIIIPVFNGAPFLKQAVLSCQKSHYSHKEVILVDDASTDKSQAICKSLAEKYQNVRLYNFKKNKGMCQALNLGIFKARGRYIARLNQDDLMVSNRLEKQVKFLEKNPDYVAVGGAIKLFTNKNKTMAKISFPLTDRAIRSQWLYLSPYSDPTVMYRKSAWQKVGGYEQSFWPADDVHLWYRMGKLGKLANFRQVLTRVRWFDGVGSIKLHRKQIKKTWRVHLWANKNIKKAGVIHWLFWTVQILAGLILPAQFNWFAYRLLRQIQKHQGQYWQKLKASLKKPIFPANKKYKKFAFLDFLFPRH